MNKSLIYSLCSMMFLLPFNLAAGESKVFPTHFDCRASALSDSDDVCSLPASYSLFAGSGPIQGQETTDGQYQFQSAIITVEDDLPIFLTGDYKQGEKWKAIIGQKGNIRSILNLKETLSRGNWQRTPAGNYECVSKTPSTCQYILQGHP